MSGQIRVDAQAASLAWAAGVGAAVDALGAMTVPGETGMDLGLVTDAAGDAAADLRAAGATAAGALRELSTAFRTAMSHYLDTETTNARSLQ